MDDAEGISATDILMLIDAEVLSRRLNESNMHLSADMRIDNKHKHHRQNHSELGAKITAKHLLIIR